MATSSSDWNSISIKCDCGLSIILLNGLRYVQCKACSAVYGKFPSGWRYRSGPNANALLAVDVDQTEEIDELATARAEIERLKEFSARQETRCSRHRAEIERLTKENTRIEQERRAIDKQAATDFTSANIANCLLERAFAFLAGLSPHFNQPALSAQGRRERIEYAELMKALREAIKPGDR